MHENHAWNCRLLRGQIELLRTAIEVAATQLIQIVECAIQYDMVQVIKFCKRTLYRLLFKNAIF